MTDNLGGPPKGGTPNKEPPKGGYRQDSMSFLHPEFAYFAPLIALPILIHLLNRIRYRRVRWAAIDFLLATERRAVRRARLKQLLLMALRMLVLAAALGALAQPIVRGGLASLLGGSRQVAVVLDASASLSAAGPGGSAFERGKRLAGAMLKSLPRGTRVTGGTFAVGYDSPFREAVQDRAAVLSVLNDAPLTGGRGDVPRALRAAAESLQRGGGGGTIWLLTDLQASGWHASESGEWEQVRAALRQAGKPQIVVTDLNPGVETNAAVESVSVAPAVLVEGDAPKLTAAVVLRSKSGGGGLANVGLFVDGQRIDSRTHEFAEPGKADVVFRLPALKGGAHEGYIELSPDALPADDRFYFVLQAAARIRVLVVDGAPSSAPFEGAADFVKLALRPPEANEFDRSTFTVESVSVQDLAGAELGGFAAVILADVPRLAPDALQRLRDYAKAGGLLIVFPGAHTDLAAWNEAKLPDVRIVSQADAPAEKRLKLGPVSPTSPITAPLPAEGLDRVLVQKLFRFETDGGATVGSSDPPYGGLGQASRGTPIRSLDVLMQTERGEAFLVRVQIGKGRGYVFAVSAQVDFSNLPFTPPFLLVLHRAISGHLVEAAAPLWRPTYTELRLALPPGPRQIIMPNGKIVPLVPGAASGRDASPTGDVVFDQTGLAGVYRLGGDEGGGARGEGRGTGESQERTALGPRSSGLAPSSPSGLVPLASSPPVAAFNVPAQESELECIDPAAIRTLLPDVAVSFLRAEGGGEGLSESGGEQTAASTFPLAALALAFLMGEVVLAWSMGRPSKAAEAEQSEHRTSNVEHRTPN